MSGSSDNTEHKKHNIETLTVLKHVSRMQIQTLLLLIAKMLVISFGQRAQPQLYTRKNVKIFHYVTVATTFRPSPFGLQQ